MLGATVSASHSGALTTPNGDGTGGSGKIKVGPGGLPLDHLAEALR